MKALFLVGALWAPTLLFGQLKYELELGLTSTAEIIPIPTTSPNEVVIGIDWAAGFTINGGVRYPIGKGYSLYGHLGYYQYRVTARTGPFVGSAGGGLQVPFYQTFVFWNSLSVEAGVLKPWVSRNRFSIMGGVGIKYGVFYDEGFDEFPRINSVGDHLFDVLKWEMEYVLLRPHTLFLTPHIRLTHTTKKSHELFLKFGYQQGLLPVFRLREGYFQDLGPNDVVEAEYEITPFDLRFSYWSITTGFVF